MKTNFGFPQIPFSSVYSSLLLVFPPKQHVNTLLYRRDVETSWDCFRTSLAQDFCISVRSLCFVCVSKTDRLRLFVCLEPTGHVCVIDGSVWVCRLRVDRCHFVNHPLISHNTCSYTAIHAQTHSGV